VNASLTSKSDYDPTDSRTTPSGNGYVRLSDDAMDHTKPAPNGGQYFLEIDGDFRHNDTDPYLSEYETVLKEPLQAGKPYQLSFIAKSTTSTNIANISMLLKQGTDTYPIMDFTQLATGDWKDYVIENWESPISGTASLIIINKTPTHSGNDYIIDNISFKEVLVGGTATQASNSGDVTEIFYITPEDCKVEDSKQVFQPAGKPYEFGGMSITSSGFYEYEEIGEDGTRQVHQLYLVIQPTIEDKVCQNSEYENHGFEIAASETQNTGELIKTITVKSKATGCEHLDSTTTLKLQVYPTYLQKISDNVNKGDIYNKYGFNIDTENLEGGLYTRKLELRTQVCACDSIIQLDLTVLQPVTPMAFFSPNGDNLNELWHVEGLDSYELGYVCIYDRHHRLLATIKGSEYKGWDGNYNGHPMPMDDYWYVITIPENNQQISGHFCLKR
jgi:gliding motility-associated-like protein